jgi:hypothetical protein
MDKLLRILVILPAITFVVTGLRYILDSASAAHAPNLVQTTNCRQPFIAV